MTTRLFEQLVVCGMLSVAAGACWASPEDPTASVHEHDDIVLPAALPAVVPPAAPALDATAAGDLRRLADPRTPETAPVPERRTNIVMRALSLLGVSYRFGGNRPETGLDCSGLVRLVFHDALGVVLPRRSSEISRAGNGVMLNQLRPGDLVFFNTLRRAFSHVGIYIGNDQFVHAPSSGGHVRIETINKRYWLARFDGARRLASVDIAELGEPAQSMVD